MALNAPFTWCISIYALLSSTEYIERMSVCVCVDSTFFLEMCTHFPRGNAIYHFVHIPI